MDLMRALTGGLAGLALVAGTSGCGAIADKASEKATEKIAESATGCEDVDFDVEGGGASANCDGRQFDASATGQAALPDGWPEDLPAPDGTQIVTSGGATDGLGYLGLVPGTVDQVAADVRATLEAAGYTIDEDASTTPTGDTVNGGSASVQASDGTFTANVLLTTDASDQESVSINWTLTPV